MGDIQLILARFVGEVGNPTPVRTPRRIALGNSIGRREIQPRALLRGQRPHVAAGAHDNPLAGRRNLAAHEPLTGVRDVRLQLRTIARYVDLDLAALAARKIQQIEPGSILEDDFALAVRAGADGRPLHVPVGVVSDLRMFVFRCIPFPDVEPMIRSGVRDVVDVIAVPHRQAVGSFPVGDPARLVCLEVEQPDIRCHSTAIALPRACVARVRRVGEPLTVVADRAIRTVRNGQIHRQPAGRRDAGKGGLAAESCETERREDEIAIACPVTEGFRRRVMCDAVRNAAGCCNRVKIAVAVVVADESDLGAAVVEAGEGLHPGGTGQRAGLAAFAGDEPEVACVGKDDVGFADVGITQHGRVRDDALVRCNRRGCHRLSRPGQALGDRCR